MILLCLWLYFCGLLVVATDGSPVNRGNILQAIFWPITVTFAAIIAVIRTAASYRRVPK